MDEFMLPVEVDGQEMELKTRLVRQGYIYKFVVVLGEREYAFERDEEGRLRAILDVEGYTALDKGEQRLLQQVCNNLQRLLD